mgnify:CR=1 FL=1
MNQTAYSISTTQVPTAVVNRTLRNTYALLGMLFVFGAGTADPENSGRSSTSAFCAAPPSRSPFSSASRTTRARSITDCGSPASRATCTP